jgi:hypothetical protein
VFIVLEPVRLAIGWKGNSGERVPELTSFLFLSLFILPFIFIYNAYLQIPLIPFDVICGNILLVFVVLEIIFGVVCIRRLISEKTLRFKVEHVAPILSYRYVAEDAVEMGDLRSAPNNSFVSH